MIKAITAYTAEIDDVETAVSEILAQLDLTRQLCTHSVGLISCYSEFIETGVTKALGDALPFDVIGCTTAGAAVPGGLGELMLCLLMLTSDDLIFASGVCLLETEAQETQKAHITAAYQQALHRLPGEPALMFAFVPNVKQVTGEILMETLNTVSSGLPIFGTQAVDYIDINEFSRSYTVFNGDGYRDALSFVLIYGDLHPSFFAASLSKNHIQKQKAVITKSEGNCVLEVNDMTLMTYLEKIGLMGLYKGTSQSFPFMLDYHDGTDPVPRAIRAVSPEGYVTFTGRMPAGATLAVGDIDYSEVLLTASELLDKAVQQKSSCIILFSCLIRYAVLGADTTAEMELADAAIGKGKPYHFSYSGGELCPVYNEKGRLVNRFHNCSFIACVL